MRYLPCYFGDFGREIDVSLTKLSLAWRNLSLRTKALVQITSLLTLLVVGAAYVFVDWYAMTAKAQMAHQLSAKLQLQADSVARLLWDFNTIDVERLVRSSTSQSAISYTAIIDAQGRLVAEAGSVDPSDELGLRGEWPILYEDTGADLGRLVMVMSGRSLELALMRLRLGSALVALTLFAVVSLIVLTSLGQFTRPLTRMTNLMSRIRAGDLDEPIRDLDRSDEIGDMARALESFRLEGLEVRRLQALEEKATVDERLRLAAAFENCMDAVIISDARGKILFSNPVSRSLVQLIADEKFRSGWIPLRMITDQAMRQDLMATLAMNRDWTGEFAIGSAEEQRWLALRVSVIHDELGKRIGYVAIASDVTEKHEAETYIRKLALHDTLTGLPNRALFAERLQEAISSAVDQQAIGALMLLDLDRFKQVNDTMGHGVGDELLKSVACRVSANLRSSDTLARLGGDEFAIVLPSIPNAAFLAKLAGRITHCLGEPFDLSDQKIFSGSSVGLTIFPRDGIEPQELLRQSDLALYAAKAAGRGTHRFFATAMDNEEQQKREIERDLRRAITNGELHVHYQPIICLKTGRLRGVEALARWWREDGTFVPPSTFIPIVEESGLIDPLGRLVMLTACRETLHWQRAGLDLTVSLNVSPVQFGRDPVGMVREIIAETGFSARFLELEITESALFQTDRNASEIVNKMRGIGCQVALDDFGTGHSSLTQLLNVPLDRIKLDQSFVSLMGDNPKAEIIVETIITLAQRLGVSVTAEGVSSAEQCEVVRHMGADQGQGYWFARPMPLEDLEMTDLWQQMLATHRTKPPTSSPDPSRVLNKA